jgi:hypothetical protein
MNYHFAHSKTETPGEYAALEYGRTGFPKAWKALFDGTREYKRVPDRAKLDSLLAAAQNILNAIAAFH